MLLLENSLTKEMLSQITFTFSFFKYSQALSKLKLKIRLMERLAFGRNLWRFPGLYTWRKRSYLIQFTEFQMHKLSTNLRKVIYKEKRQLLNRKQFQLETPQVKTSNSRKLNASYKRFKKWLTLNLKLLLPPLQSLKRQTRHLLSKH